MLSDAGLVIAENRRLALEDHAKFDTSTLKSLVKMASETGADSIVMTEKDAVKADVLALKLPVYAVQLKLEIDNQVGFYDAVLKRSGLIDELPLQCAPGNGELQ
jgi:tetraacyldisaccharide-1-P 4'-kinase